MLNMKPPADSQLADQRCPKCRAEMEPIESGDMDLPFQDLQLCPDCYLVTWVDHDGPHFRQGVPVKNDLDYPQNRDGLTGEPQEC